MLFLSLIACIGAMPVETPNIPNGLAKDYASSAPAVDWLLDGKSFIAKVHQSDNDREIVLGNGLVKRVLRVDPNTATVSLENCMTGEEMLRAVKPEARITIDGATYDIGGLTGQPEMAFLRREWIDGMKSDPSAFHYSGFRTGDTVERFPWKRVRHSENLPWPPPGAGLTLLFAPPTGKLPGITVEIHYEMYDGLPVYSKWIAIKNSGPSAVRLDSFTSEILAPVEAESAVGAQSEWRLPNLYVASDYSFGGDTPENANHVATWVSDSTYTSQVNYERKMPAMLVCSPPLGPSVDIPSGETFESYHIFTLVFDGYDRERNGLAVRRLYRSMAPWCTENPLMLHLTSTDPATVKTAMDQCAECGFEMVIFSFGSGLNMEDASPENIARYKKMADYAHSKGLEVGGYSLLASRSISQDVDVVNPKTGKTDGAIFGSSPCLCTDWGRTYFEHIAKFIKETGFNLLEHDGSYPGDVCASTAHSGHRGLEDSQWKQFQVIASFYHWCRATGIFLNVPDWYFLSGSNKSGMGYRESNWSLPRETQIILARQNMYDGTWTKTPSMGWMFVPLVEYQGGGAAATIEPLKNHLSTYEAHLANYLGFGVQACYRGPRLYDSEDTKALVVKWVQFFKKHRAILESDIVHLRRADGRDLDAILHVNPKLTEKAMAFVYNPTKKIVASEITLPLYYTGLAGTAKVREHDGKVRTFKLDRAYNIKVPVRLEAEGSTWITVE